MRAVAMRVVMLPLIMMIVMTIVVLALVTVVIVVMIMVMSLPAWIDVRRMVDRDRTIDDRGRNDHGGHPEMHIDMDLSCMTGARCREKQRGPQPCQRQERYYRCFHGFLR